MTKKIYKYLALALSFTSIAYGAHREHSLERSRGSYFRECPAYDIQRNWIKHDHECIQRGIRAVGSDIPHFEWELRKVENTENPAHCDMCGKGMFEREDTFTVQYYATHPLYDGEILIGKECFRHMEKKINGDREIRDTLDVTNGPRKRARR